MKVWVIGAKGLLGQALVFALQNQGIDWAESSHIDADITSPESLDAFYQLKGPFSHIVNCAAYTKVDLAESAIQEAYRVNVDGPRFIGELAQAKGVRVVHVSTDYVFDGNGARPYLESDPAMPQTVYGRTKAQGEVRLFQALPSACVVRTSWIFGMGGKNFVSTMLDLMRSRQEVRVVADQIGKPTWSLDLAHVLVQALNCSGIYHAANDGETSWHGFAEAIWNEAKQVGYPLLCERIIPIESSAFPTAAKRPLYSVLDTKRVELLLGASMPHWKKGLKKMLEEICASN